MGSSQETFLWIRMGSINNENGCRSDVTLKGIVILSVER